MTCTCTILDIVNLHLAVIKTGLLIRISIYSMKLFKEVYCGHLNIFAENIILYSINLFKGVYCGHSDSFADEH